MLKIISHFDLLLGAKIFNTRLRNTESLFKIVNKHTITIDLIKTLKNNFTSNHSYFNL